MEPAEMFPDERHAAAIPARYERRADTGIAAQLRPGAPLMFTAGPSPGIAMGWREGEPLFHASLSRDEYAAIIQRAGCAVEGFRPGEPVGEGPSVYLARRQISPAKGLDGSA